MTNVSLVVVLFVLLSMTISRSTLLVSGLSEGKMSPTCVANFLFWLAKWNLVSTTCALILIPVHTSQNMVVTSCVTTKNSSSQTFRVFFCARSTHITNAEYFVEVQTSWHTAKRPSVGQCQELVISPQLPTYHLSLLALLHGTSFHFQQRFPRCNFCSSYKL